MTAPTTASSSSPAADGPAAEPADPGADLLPNPTPIRFLDDLGHRLNEPVLGRHEYAEPSVELLERCWQAMLIGRRFDVQATALTKQGRLAVYPSSRGQEACQVAGVLALRSSDWVFPTYRDAVAIMTRGIDPIETLSLLRGDSHCGYDPIAAHTAAQCTPLATALVHAAGVAHGEARRGRDTVALGFVGDGATSEGDFHEALNFAAVFNAPAIFLVQNNKYAISVPLAKQTKAPSLAHKGVGYGVRAEQVDGNDPVAMLAVLTAAVQRARTGGGPFLLEAHTYRIDAHTNADDASRYREADEVTRWLARDPIARLETYLRDRGAVDDAALARVEAQAEDLAADVRARMNIDPVVDPMSLFENVFAEPTPQLLEQRAMVAAELAAQDDGVAR